MDSHIDACIRFWPEFFKDGWVATYYQRSDWFWKMRVDRGEEKDFRVLWFDGKRFRMSGAPKPFPLYMKGNSDLVWIVEGEKCVDALAEIGVCACTSGSYTSAGDVDWSTLAGRRVRIWPDNDKSGRIYGEEVRAILEALDCVVEVVDVDRLGLEEKGDCVDWINSRRDEVTESDLLALGLEEEKKPLPILSKVERKPYPIEWLPAILSNAVKEVQEFIKAPISLVATSAISSLSLVVQPYVNVRRSDKLSGPVSLFTITIADSGERKSSCDAFFLKVIQDYENDQSNMLKDQLVKYVSESDVFEAKRNGLKDRIRQLSKSGKSSILVERELFDLEKRKPIAPKIPRLIYTDSTPEALGYSLAKKWPSGGVMSSEGGIVLGSHGMQKDSIMRNLSQFNTLWDGNPLRIDRRTSESYEVRDVRLTMGLQIQEDSLREFFDRNGKLARGIGFLSRVLMAWPESTQGFRPFTEHSTSWPALESLNARVSEILHMPIPINADGTLTPHTLTMSDDGKKEWVDFYNTIESKLSVDGEFYDIRDVASKIADNVIRLAAIFHVIESGTEGCISCQNILGACKLAEWHLNESLRFFCEISRPEEQTNSDILESWLIKYCQSEDILTISPRDISRLGPSKIRKKHTRDEALSELQESGRISFVEICGRIMVKVNVDAT
jgi:hypothetical protein